MECAASGSFLQCGRRQNCRPDFPAHHRKLYPTGSDHPEPGSSGTNRPSLRKPRDLSDSHLFGSPHHGSSTHLSMFRERRNIRWLQLGSVPHEPDGVSPDAALVAESVVTSATTVGSTLVSATRSRPPLKRFEPMVSGQGWSADAGVRTAARERDWAVVMGTLRPAMTSVPSR